MKKEQRASHTKPALPEDTSPTKGHRRIDSIDQPARPLGNKRAALQLRRQQAKPKITRSNTSKSGDISSLTSCDGSVTFTLQKTPQGLLVHREQMQPVGQRLVQTLIFTTLFTFDRWCSVEPMRFEDAVLYQQLLREGHAALGGQQ